MDKGEEKYLILRDGIVHKSNEIIQKSRHQLNAQQQKIVLFLISQIKPWDEDFKLYEFDILDFCKTCGIDPRSGGNYELIKQQIKQIADQSIEAEIIKDGEPVWTILRWIEKPYINARSGTIKIKLDADMKPFLLQLKERFTKYELIYTLKFESKYSIRLYEYTKSVHYNEFEPRTMIFTVNDLACHMGAEKYKEYKDFKRRALLPAIKEINEYSDQELTFEEIKTRRKVTGIKLTIREKEAMERIQVVDRIQKELGTDQLTLWDQMLERQERIEQNGK